MLYVIAYLLIVSLSTSLVGLFCWRAVQSFLNDDTPPPGLAALCLFGLVAHMLLTSFWVLFLPLSGIFCLAMVFLPVAALGHSPTRMALLERLQGLKPASWPHAVLLGLFTLTLILKAASPSEIFDDGIAHLPVLASLRQAGTVIGLANLHPNFGYNTHSTLAQGLYALPELFGCPVYAFNAWLGLVCGFTLIGCLASKRPGTYFAMAFTLTPLMILRSQLTGLSTDPGHYLLAWTLLARWILHPEDRRGIHGFFWFGMGVALAITFKINAMPLGILSLMWLWSERHNPKLAITGIGVMVLFLAPWLARNVLLTGYLFLLVPKSVVPFADWAVPQSVLRRLTEQVQHEIFHQSGRFESGYWRQWWQSIGSLNRLVVVGAGLGLLLLTRSVWKDRSLLPALLVLLSGLALWVATVTEMRYAHAWLAPLATMGFAGLIPHGGSLGRNLGPWWLFWFVIFYAALNVQKSYKEFALWPEVLIAPAPRPEAIWTERKLQGRSIFIPLRFKTRADDRLRVPEGRAPEVIHNQCGCWNTPFPCLYRSDDLRHLEWRGETLREGFRIK